MTESIPLILAQIRENPRIRHRLAFESPLWFSLLYLQRHFKHSFAPFHLEMFHLIQNDYPLVVVMAFRESGKSAVMNMANTLWSILGKPEKKFVIIVSKTQEQAKNHFANIKAELENNEALKADFGPFTENASDWNKLSLELEYHGSKIISVTRDQSIRGLKHGQYRPDLIILDDVEDLGDDGGNGDRIYEWFNAEIIPLGNSGTKVIVLGNLICHFDEESWALKRSFILRLRSEILDGNMAGLFRAYPLVDEVGKVLWEHKFPDRGAVEKLRNKLTKGTWIREYLLRSFGQNNEDGPNVRFIEGYEYAFARLIEDTGWHMGDNHRTPIQRPLIEAMNKFRIAVPSHAVAFFKSSTDATYKEYMENLYL